MRTRWLWIVVIGCACAMAGCDDDDSVVEADVRWEEVDAGDFLAPAALFALGASSSRTLAVGRATDGPFVLELAGDTWTRTDLDGASTLFAFDVAFATDGRAVVVGGGPAAGAAVWAERPAFTHVDLTSSGALRTVVRDTDGNFVASGTGSSSIPLARGGIDGDWTTGTVPTPGDPQEKALECIVAHPSGLFAVGWDDGGEGTPESPTNMLLHFDGQSWELVPMPCGGCTQTELRALAVLPNGSLVVGGARTDWSASEGIDPSTAMLSFYDPGTEQWTEIVLPQAGALDRVNRVVLASDGALVLACGRDGGASLAVLAAQGGGDVEWFSESATIFALVEAHDGTLLAGGVRENGELLLLRRVAPR